MLWLSPSYVAEMLHCSAVELMRAADEREIELDDHGRVEVSEAKEWDDNRKSRRESKTGGLVTSVSCRYCGRKFRNPNACTIHIKEKHPPRR